MTQAPPIPTAPPTTAAPPAIECSGVWKQYYFYAHRPRRLKEVFAGGAGPRPRITPGNTSEPVWALRDFHLSVYPGQTVGVVGNNGAGKSTLLKLLSRILQPTRGQLRVRGRTAAIIELGAGFHEELTAKENVYLAGSFLGLRKRQINELYPQIVEFAELGPHMDMPVKYFSSGMHARLGFSIAVSVNPDVLLIDEVLAVGDVGFQAKCKDRIAQFQQGGKAILFVSHDLATVKSLCQRVLWLKEGVTMADGDPVTSINAYLEHYWPGCTKG